MNRNFAYFSQTGLAILLVGACCIPGFPLQAQSENSSRNSSTNDERTVIIVEETTEKDGVVTTKKTITAKGDFEEDELMQMLRKEMGDDVDFIRSLGEEEIEIEKEIKQPSPKGWVGIYLEEDGNGVSVTEVVDGSPASRAGLKAGDVITRVNQSATENSEQFVHMIAAFQPGDVVEFEVIRSGEEVEIPVTLGSRGDARVIDRADRDREHQYRVEKEKHGKHKEKHKADAKPRFGVSIDDSGGEGVLVTGVYNGSYAEQAGLEEGDILTAFNGQPVSSIRDLQKAVTDAPAGEKIKVKYLRDGKKKRTKFTFGE